MVCVGTRLPVPFLDYTGLCYMEGFFFLFHIDVMESMLGRQIYSRGIPYSLTSHY
jgi:hypothetical protein